MIGSCKIVLVMSLVGLAALTAGACGAEKQKTEARAVPVSTTIEGDGDPLPSYVPPDPPTYPTALFTGTVEIDQRCAYLLADGVRRLLVWHPGTELAQRNGRSVVVSDSGTVRATDGAVTTVTGGDVPASAPMVAALQTSCAYQQLTVVNP